MRKNVPNSKISFDPGNLDDRTQIRFEYDSKGNLVRVWREPKKEGPKMHAIVGGFILTVLLILIMLLFGPI